MNDAYFTTTGERQDLAALEVNAPEGFIGGQLFPTLPVADKVGYIYYATVEADGAAQTGRSAFAAPSSTEIAASSTTFTAAEAVKRAGITPDEVKLMGGIEKADEIGAKWAKRQVMRAIETAQCAAVFGLTVEGHFDPAKLMTDAQTALDDIRLYPGLKALVGSTKTLKTIVQSALGDPNVGAAFSRIISGSAPGVAAEGFSFKTWKNALAMLLGVDVVLAGDDNIWNATAYAGYFAFCALPDPNDPMSHRYNPELGKTAQFVPDGKQPFVIQSIGDRYTVANYYDAYSWYNVKALNTGAAYLFDGATP